MFQNGVRVIGVPANDTDAVVGMHAGRKIEFELSTLMRASRPAPWGVKGRCWTLGDNVERTDPVPGVICPAHSYLALPPANRGVGDGGGDTSTI